MEMRMVIEKEIGKKILKNIQVMRTTTTKKWHSLFVRFFFIYNINQVYVSFFSLIERYLNFFFCFFFGFSFGFWFLVSVSLLDEEIMYQLISVCVCV